MARIKIGDWLIEDAALTTSGGRLCLRWAADAWDGTLDSAAELLGVASELREVDADDMTVALSAGRAHRRADGAAGGCARGGAAHCGRGCGCYDGGRAGSLRAAV